MLEMDPIDISSLSQPSYIGSVQKLYYLAQSSELMVCETTAGGSVFDVGTIFHIEGSDLCRTVLRHKVYTLLKSPQAWQAILEDAKMNEALEKADASDLIDAFATSGAATHHIGILDAQTGTVHSDTFPQHPSNFVLVKRYPILKPESLIYRGRQLWDYSLFYKAENFVVPLENIVRFGTTPGSSIYLKFLKCAEDAKSAYLKKLGLDMPMEPWTLFNCPTIDHTTKHEPEDRNLSPQEALHISGCDRNDFVHLTKMSMLGSLIVLKFFQKLNLQLWDLKWEIAKCGEDLVFVDTLDTDSMRVTTQVNWEGQSYHVHFNKQAMRDYYKMIHPLWYAALNKAKTEAKEKGVNFQDYFKKGQARGLYPDTPEVHDRFLAIQSRKFKALLHYTLEDVSLDITQKEIHGIAQEEIEFYARSGTFEQFKQFNQVPLSSYTNYH